MTSPSGSDEPAASNVAGAPAATVAGAASAATGAALGRCRATMGSGGVALPEPAV